ncbi:MAG: DUF541 domain-containing protein, partial [Alphaproteobacteria bacterium]
MKTPTFTRLMLAGTAIAIAAAPVAASAKDKDDDSTTVQVSAEARKMVQQDRVMATLAIETEGASAEKVQAEINTKMVAAQKLYSKVAGVKATTGGYNVYKDYRPETGPKPLTEAEREKLAFWRGSQEINLDGVKKDELLALIGDLQKQGFATRGLNFYMSREAADAVKDDLIVDALKNIKARAENIQRALGMKTIQYSRIDLGDNGVRPYPVMARGAMMKAEAFDAT